MKKALVFFVFAFALAFAANARENNTPNPQSFANKKAPLSFIENKGQVTDQSYQPRPDIQFQLKAANGLTIFVGDGAIHYQFAKADKLSNATKRDKRILHDKFSEQIDDNYTLYRMDVELIGANKQAKIITEDKKDYYENYYTTGTGENGVTVYAYSKITYKDIYPNIDWVLYTRNNELKHEFIVKQGGNPADIKLKYGGATNLQLQKDGSLEATTPQGTITEQAPVSYTQEGQQVTSSFNLKENVLSYEVGNYEGDLVIDPSLVWSTYMGGTGTELCYKVTTDKFNNVFISGNTTSLANIATVGTYQQTMTGGSNYDAFIVKFNNNGNRIWGTYFGGNTMEWCWGLATDKKGNVYITGESSSASNIASPGAFQTVLNGFSDIFLAKFNSNGIRNWSTYLGGNDLDYGYAVTADSNCNVFITGYTNSANFYVTSGSFQTIYGGVTDAYLTKFDSTGNILWSTFMGGNNGECGISMVTDHSNNIVMFGYTASPNGISTPNSFQNTYSGGNDNFVVKFDNNGNKIWGTYFGGPGYEYDEGDIEVDKYNNIYFTGFTQSVNLSTPGTYQPIIAGNFLKMDAYLEKFDANGNRIWGTYFGGIGEEYGDGVAVDKNGFVYLCGLTMSIAGIATPGAFQSTIAADHEDGYLAKFDNTGNLLWASYFGGSTSDRMYDMAADTNNNIFFSGWTESNDVLTTAGAYQTTSNGYDAFLGKINDSCYGLPPVISAIVGPDTICAGQISAFTNSVSNGFWSVADTNVALVDAWGNLKAKNMGTTVLSYFLTNTCGTDAKTKTINILPSPSVTLSPSTNTSICPNSSLLIQASGGNSVAYQWKFNNNLITGATNNNFTVSQAGKYKVVVTNATNGCSTTSDSVVVSYFNVPTALINVVGQLINCVGNTVSLVANSGTGLTYQWYVNTSIIPNATNKIYSPNQSGDYWVIISANGNCPDTAKAVTVIFYPNPIATITALSDTVFCENGSVQLKANMNPWFTYQWYKNGVSITGSTDSVFTANAAGVYKVKVMDTVCSSLSNSINVTVHPLPNVVITQNINDCSTASIYVNYQWYFNGVAISGATNAQYTITQDGDYYLVVTDSNGCTGQSNLMNATVVGIDNINEHPLWSVYPNPFHENFMVTCPFATGTITVTDIVGKKLFKQNLSKSTQTISMSGFASGVYFLQYKDAAGRTGTIKIVKE